MPDQMTGLLSGYLRARRIGAVRACLGRGTVLDYGCGVGELARIVPAECYTGVDEDEESLRIARSRFPGHAFIGLREFERCGAGAPRDVIVALAVIEHVADPGHWLASMAARLAARGRIVLTTPHPRFAWIHRLGARLGLFSRAGAEQHGDLLDRRSLEAVAAKAGLVMTEYRRFLAGANQVAVLRPKP